MVTIKVLGPTPPCARCQRALREALQAAERFPGQVTVEKVDALSPEAEAYGMVVTPGIVLNGELIASGKVLPADLLIRRIQAILGG
ncbi:MAG: thioredoxin family protein [Chloroflexi bacterium]|jgi:hypothetical protein|nr:thioredoxin family protein [Chloroflexota bacterium]